MNIKLRLRQRHRDATDASEFQYPWDELLLDTRAGIDTQQADCCVARARFRIVLPARESRSRPAELLLCGHHFRVSRDGLRRASAAAFDAHDHLCGVAD